MNRWRLEQELFEQTAELDPESRARILAERGGGDEELVRRVERLVAADTRPLPALDGTASDLWDALRDEPAPESLIGAEFGAYRVDAFVASGGMAHVYLATRTSAGASRRVALKVIRSVPAGNDLPARFVRERAMLAALEHEHIVSFLDAGSLADGRPYLVMEFVAGRPITEWGRDEPIARRVETFLAVLSAVQYAHQKLVVHRDLKPSNVLVTNKATPKILDFGIATMLGADRNDDAGAPLTPAYASPEQLRGEPVTTASDVYSLGVLLRELLAAGAGTRPPVPGDLAAIVDKALAPDPADRYRSADEFAADLRRFLAFEPVLARPRSWRHRARLFARRHRGPLALFASVFVAAVAGWIGSDLKRRAAESEASLGWGAHAQAKSAAAVFEQWIAAAAEADPAAGAAAAAHLENALSGTVSELPEAETIVRLALAELYLRLGDSDRAAHHADRALALARVTPGVSNAERRRAAELSERARSTSR